MKKQLSALSVLLGLEFFSLGLFTHGTFSGAIQHFPPLLKAASQTDARAVKLDSSGKTDYGFVSNEHGELTPRSGIVLTAKENRNISLRSSIVIPLFFRIILAPKVSRYLSKSVLNI